MKILFDHHSPFFLAHGGFQTQIEQTKYALEQIGVEVEYIRWWDDAQEGDIIHYFGRPYGGYIHFAHQKGLKVVVAELHAGLGSRSSLTRLAQKTLMQACQKMLPSSFTAKLAWEAYRDADAFVALTPWEASLMQDMFGAQQQKIHVIPNGVEKEFFLKKEPGSSKPTMKDYLICTATITERKRVLELAESAVLAETPVMIIGKPYAESDPYYQKFIHIAKTHSEIVRFCGPIQDREQLARLYQEARGFVLLSTMESLSLSALEAAASGCPLLLGDLPWARSVFGDNVFYCPITDNKETAKRLKRFYSQMPDSSKTFSPKSWQDIAQSLVEIYTSLLK